jgi:hypothetical protein
MCPNWPRYPVLEIGLAFSCDYRNLSLAIISDDGIEKVLISRFPQMMGRPTKRNRMQLNHIKDVGTFHMQKMVALVDMLIELF